MPITDNYYYEPLYPARPQRKNFGAAPIIRIFISELLAHSSVTILGIGSERFRRIWVFAIANAIFLASDAAATLSRRC